MRFLRINNACVDYEAYLYSRNPGLATAPYAVQKQRVEHDHFGWGNAYTRALAGIGYNAEEFVADILPLQRAWAAEHGIAECSPGRIVLEQVRSFQPEVLQFEINDGRLLSEIRAAVPSIRLVIGWEGSALSTGRAWPGLDLILSCAPEAVAALRRLGLRSEHLNHAFDPDVCERLGPTRRSVPISFIGSIIRRNQFHVQRDRILSELAGSLPLEIYSPSVAAGCKTYAKAAAAAVAYVAVGGLKSLGVEAPRRPRLLAQAYRVASRPRLPVNPALRRHLRPPAFGLDYFQIMRDSEVSLNIHADSSPTHASNIRLFEATGVGSCLLTDDRPNLAGLFTPDTEVVTYRSASECLEKAKWLLSNPAARNAIAARGMARTRSQHTFAQRALEVDDLLKNVLAGRAAPGVTMCA